MCKAEVRFYIATKWKAMQSKWVCSVLDRLVSGRDEENVGQRVQWYVPHAVRHTDLKCCNSDAKSIKLCARSNLTCTWQKGDLISKLNVIQFCKSDSVKSYTRLRIVHLASDGAITSSGASFSTWDFQGETIAAFQKKLWDPASFQSAFAWAVLEWYRETRKNHREASFAVPASELFARQ